jgi:hypothetical protein
VYPHRPSPRAREGMYPSPSEIHPLFPILSLPQPFTQPQASVDLFSVNMIPFYFLDFYINRIIQSLCFFLASFIPHKYFHSSHVIQCILFRSLLLLSSSLLYGYTTIHQPADHIRALSGLGQSQTKLLLRQARIRISVLWHRESFLRTFHVKLLISAQCYPSKCKFLFYCKILAIAGSFQL